MSFAFYPEQEEKYFGSENQHSVESFSIVCRTSH